MACDVVKQRENSPINFSMFEESGSRLCVKNLHENKAILRHDLFLSNLFISPLPPIENIKRCG